MKTRTLALAGASIALIVLLAACGSATANSPEASTPGGHGRRRRPDRWGRGRTPTSPSPS